MAAGQAQPKAVPSLTNSLYTSLSGLSSASTLLEDAVVTAVIDVAREKDMEPMTYSKFRKIEDFTCNIFFMAF